MKKFYVLIVVIICSAAQGFSQTWAGGPSGSWNNTANWNPAVIPDANTADVTINGSVSITLDASVQVRSITIIGDVRIDGGTGINEITMASASPAVTVNLGATLRIFQSTIIFTGNTTGDISGTLVLEGTNDLNFGFLDFENAGPNTEININGTFTDEFGTGILTPNEDFINFGPTSKYRLTGVNPIITKADYHVSSEIIITGVTTNSVTFDEKGNVGIVTYNCPGQVANASRTLNIPNELVLYGLNIQNTNGNNLSLISNVAIAPGKSVYEFTVNGDLNISGNSVVTLSNSQQTADPYQATINGNFTMSGTTFNLQNSNNASVKSTTLFVTGNINHTSGTITASSTAAASTASLFNIEMNGASAQTITSSTGIFNNAGNQVALRISNPTGVTLLSPLNVGMLGFSANGKLNTDGTNFITVINPSAAAYVVSGSGFVAGPMRRATNSASEYIFPTGAGTTARYVSVFPSATTGSTYQASYTNAAPANTTVTFPLINIVNYYWQVDRIGGADAFVELTLPGAVSGANSSHALVVSKSSGGADWVSSRNLSDNTFLPGDATSGKVRSELQTSFSSFTIGWGPMDAVLPINLLSFTVNKSGSKANLNWRISENSTPRSFEIMKSADGINFSKIGTVQGLTAKLSYDFTDNNLLTGNNYYRLKMLDIDGTISYSNIIAAMNGTTGTMITSMIPTMVVDRARLNISSASKGNMQLVITDINGRIIQTQNTSINAGNQEVWINATRLASGYFQVTGYINGEKTSTIRFFKR